MGVGDMWRLLVNSGGIWRRGTMENCKGLLLRLVGNCWEGRARGRCWVAQEKVAGAVGALGNGCGIVESDLEWSGCSQI
jgi:hypothetical protein